MKKYELVEDINAPLRKNSFSLPKTFRIRALRDIPIPRDIYGSMRYLPPVKKGDLGGFVQSENNLSQEGLCWIYDNSIVINSAIIADDASVMDNSLIMDNAKITGESVIKESIIGQNAKCDKYSLVFKSQISDNAYVSDHARITNSKLYSKCKAYNNCTIEGSSLYNLAEVFDRAHISNSTLLDKVKIYGCASIKNSSIKHRAQIYESAIISNSKVENQAKVAENAKVKFSYLTRSIINNKNIEDSIRVQCGLPVLMDSKGKYVIGFKHVRKTKNENVFASIRNASFLYTIKKIAKEDDFDKTNRSCAKGLHFSGLSYWENHNGNAVIMVKCYLKDIITVQEGKIRCKKLLVLGKVLNGVK